MENPYRSPGVQPEARRPSLWWRLRVWLLAALVGAVLGEVLVQARRHMRRDAFWDGYLSALRDLQRLPTEPAPPGKWIPEN